MLPANYHQSASAGGAVEGRVASRPGAGTRGTSAWECPDVCRSAAILSAPYRSGCTHPTLIEYGGGTSRAGEIDVATNANAGRRPPFCGCVVDAR